MVHSWECYRDTSGPSDGGNDTSKPHQHYKAKSSGSRKEWHRNGRRFMMVTLLRKARLMQLEEAEKEPVDSPGNISRYAVGPRGGAAQCIGATEAAEEAGGRTVFESSKRKRSHIDNCSDTERFWGPREGHVEKRAVKPSEGEVAELEILARRQVKRRRRNDKPLDKKSELHSRTFWL
ncbi:uncharacterized protein LOC111866559 isoform X1 [Cryptotermes secundus]|uniref:uncharacterized protein LOC111866559 isoform X1 n=1 Tax=Cryptotermes secundus TaxID=105785 RepID=UPI000CD7B55E|nr:uncharacterized protein LOC111866559 isoform X1 [Cryptotermes secundus]